MLTTATAIRYLTPLREGGSLPGVLEADDLGTYVVKFRGAGQGRKALIAEVVVGELARVLGLPMPELAVIDLPEALVKSEPDEEIQDLLRASVGTNLGIDFLPGSFAFDPAVCKIDPELAAQIMWLDGLTCNVDRSWRNPNLLVWRGNVWLIDHGAALYVHHSWDKDPMAAAIAAAAKAYPQPGDHVLIRCATSLLPVAEALRTQVTPTLLDHVLDQVPIQWLQDDSSGRTPEELKSAYAAFLQTRAATPSWVAQMEVARAAAV